MPAETKYLFERIDEVFAELRNQWELFEDCSFDDLFLSRLMQDVLTMGGIGDLRTLVNTPAEKLYESCLLNIKQLRRLQKCAVALYEREAYPPEGMDITLKYLREIDSPELDRPIEGDVTIRASNALKRASIITYRDVSKRTAKQLMMVRNLGRKSLKSINAAITTFIQEAGDSKAEDSHIAPSSVAKVQASKKADFLAVLAEAATIEESQEALSKDVAIFIRQKANDALLRLAGVFLTDRSYDVFAERHLRNEKQTLEDIGKKHGVSRERIRQIDQKAARRIVSVFRRDPVPHRMEINAFYDVLCMLNPAQLKSYLSYIRNISDVDADIIQILAHDAGIQLAGEESSEAPSPKTVEEPEDNRRTSKTNPKGPTSLDEAELTKAVYLACYEFATRYEGYRGYIYPGTIRSVLAGSTRSFVANFAQEYAFYGYLPKVTVEEVKRIMRCKAFKVCMRRYYSKRTQEFYSFDPHSEEAIALKREFEEE